MSAWISVASLVLLLGWLRTRLSYRISPRHLKVRLFGLCVRRFPLSEIASISKHPGGWAEHWENTWRSKHRCLVLHRHRGWLKNVIVTPDFRYEFWSELECAIERTKKAAGN